MDWIAKVQNGDLSAIPRELTWGSGGRRVALLVDGYELAKFSLKQAGKRDTDGLELASFVNSNVRRQLEQGEAVGAIHLWISMFFEARRERFMAMPSGLPQREDCLLDVMSGKLAAAIEDICAADADRLRKFVVDRASRFTSGR